MSGWEGILIFAKERIIQFDCVLRGLCAEVSRGEEANELWVSGVYRERGSGKGGDTGALYMMTAQSLFLAFCVVMPCRVPFLSAITVVPQPQGETHHLCKGGRLLLLRRLWLHLNRLRTPGRRRRRSPDLRSVLRRRVGELVTDRSRSVRVLLRLMLREPARIRRPRRGGSHPRGGFDLADRVLPPERARRVRSARALT